MNLLYAIFFGAGITAYVYSKFGRRLGYDNSQNQLILASVVLVLSTIIFYTILVFIIPK